MSSSTDAPSVQPEKLVSELEAGLLRGPAVQVADGALCDAALLGNLRLGDASSHQLGNDTLPVHEQSSINRVTDILDIGKPIVNIGKLMGMEKRERTPFGSRMYAARKRADMTQKQAARAIGINQSTVSELETEAHSSGYTIAFAALYGVDPHWLAMGDADDDASGPVPAEPHAQGGVMRTSSLGLAQSVSLEELTVPPTFEWEKLQLKKPEELPREFWAPAPDDAVAPHAREGQVVVYVRVTDDPATHPKFGKGALVRTGGRYYLRIYSEAPSGWKATATSAAFMSFDPAEVGDLELVAAALYVQKPFGE